MVRLDRNTLAFVAMAVALGQLLAGVLGTFGQAVAGAILEVFDRDATSSVFGASFNIGDVDVVYGIFVGAVLSFGLAVCLTLVLRRYFVKPS